LTTRAPIHIGGDHPRAAPLAASAPQPGRVRTCALLGALAALVLVAGPAAAQPGKKSQPSGPAGKETPKPPAGGDVEPAGAAPKGGKAKVFDFTGLDISGRLRTPQLLYFLDRANEELERASLERRSFIPEMVRSVDEGNL
jgi:hypothetical protein